MQKVIAVEKAKALMNEAKNWSVWRWMIEKGKVRTAADEANGALDELDKRVKATWSDALKNAYRELEAEASFKCNPRAKTRYERAKEEAKDIDPYIKLAVRRVKEADEQASDARMEAEETFETAERQLSASMARAGTEKAIHCWDLRLKAIRKAEALVRRS